MISGHEGYIKPEPEIYEILLERYKLTPESLIFIDDRADNVAQAESMGINAIQFIDPDQLEAALKAYNVL